MKEDKKVAILERWREGDIIKERYDNYRVYRVLGGVGKSGMGVVYICLAEKQMLPVAMKTLQERYLASKDHQELFKKEAQAWV
jgi:serine/threonine protein kinase